MGPTMKNLKDMMGALGGMPEAGAEPPASEKTESEGTGEVSDEEMQHAKDMGFGPEQAAALKRFIRSCIAEDESGGYEETETSPASQVEGDM